MDTEEITQADRIAHTEQQRRRKKRHVAVFPSRNSYLHLCSVVFACETDLTESDLIQHKTAFGVELKEKKSNCEGKKSLGLGLY